MIVLICGDRNWTDRKAIEDFINTLPRGSVIVEGDCRGADRIAGAIGEAKGFHVYKFQANWSRYGKAAGPIRNEKMIVYGKPDLVVAFHNDLSKSRGTRDMINRAKRHGIPYQVIKSDNQQAEG
mgnify:CR=1 FL=1